MHIDIDPSVVLATREYVDDRMEEHTQSSDPHPQYAARSHRHGWGDIDGKPETYPPSVHQHSALDALTALASHYVVCSVFAISQSGVGNLMTLRSLHGQTGWVRTNSIKPGIAGDYEISISGYASGLEPNHEFVFIVSKNTISTLIFNNTHNTGNTRGNFPFSITTIEPLTANDALSFYFNINGGTEPAAPSGMTRIVLRRLN